MNFYTRNVYPSKEPHHAIYDTVKRFVGNEAASLTTSGMAWGSHTPIPFPKEQFSILGIWNAFYGVIKCPDELPTDTP